MSAFNNTSPKNPTRRSLSPAGIDLIKQFEGFRASLYNDSAGHCTIGYGTLVHRGPCNGSEPGEYLAGISEDRATDLLLQRVRQFENVINDSVKITLNQNQFDALVSFVYNVGAGAFRRSTLLKKVNTDPADAAIRAEFLRWVRAGGKKLPGLVSRREWESRLYFS